LVDAARAFVAIGAIALFWVMTARGQTERSQ
jgi:hypothetical protein